jgi:phage repressor protein C with HTH and peptisase S24 domain
MSSGEDTLYIYTDSTDSYRPGATFFVDLAYNDDVDGKHLLFYDEKHIEEFSNVFGDDWAELFLHWANKEYEPKLKRYFNEIDWEITGVN